MRAIDLCCGLGWWAFGLVEEGWDVTGVDVTEMIDPRLEPFPGEKIIADVRELKVTDLPACDLVVASPPCTEFARRTLPYGSCRKFSAQTPDLSIVTACFRLAILLRAPLVLENVRGAVPFIGPPSGVMGPWYLWGDGVPPLLPQTGRKNKFGRQGDFEKPPFDDHAHRMKSAWRARIPIELSRCVGRWHRVIRRDHRVQPPPSRLLEGK